MEVDRIVAVRAYHCCEWIGIKALSDVMLNFFLRETVRATMASAIILNTFDDFERPVLEAMAQILPPIYTVGPLSFLIDSHHVSDGLLAALRSNLWKEESGCFKWLQGRKPGSVVFVNFGSITVMSNTQLVEFAWGLANCEYDFLWTISAVEMRAAGSGCRIRARRQRSSGEVQPSRSLETLSDCSRSARLPAGVWRTFPRKVYA